jgi:hypothetical protein
MNIAPTNVTPTALAEQSDEPGFDATDYATRYPSRAMPRFATIDYLASVCTLVRAACGSLKNDAALTDAEVKVVDSVFFTGKSSKVCAAMIIAARPRLRRIA